MDDIHVDDARKQFAKGIGEITKAIWNVGTDRPFTRSELYALDAMLDKTLEAGFHYARARADEVGRLYREGLTKLPVGPVIDHPNHIKGDGDLARDLGIGGAK